MTFHIMRYIIPLFSIFLISLQAQQVRIVATDLFNESFSSMLSQGIHLGPDGVSLEQKGTRAALAQIGKNEADIAIVVIPPGKPLPAEPVMSIPLACQTVFAVTRQDLPISQINFEQLDHLFCDDAPASLRTWGDMGATGHWATRPIIPLITAPEADLGYDLFRHTALRSPKIRPTVVVFNNAEALLKRMTESDDGALAITLKRPDDSKLKILRLARSPEDRAYEITPEALQAGDYPIRLSFYLVFKKENVSKVLEIVRYLLSEDSEPMWEAQNLIPLPQQVRNQSLFDLEVL